MKHLSRASYVIAWLAIAGFCLPAPAALGIQPATDDQSSIRDIALRSGGLLTGQVLDAKLRPSAGAQVTIRGTDATVATTQSDTNGTFAVTGLRGGIHQIVTPTGNVLCRFWAPGTAPPCAVDQIAMIDDQTVVRGQAGPQFRQGFHDDVKAIAKHPLLLGGLIAAAIAIPAALRNADRAPGS